MAYHVVMFNGLVHKLDSLFNSDVHVPMSSCQAFLALEKQ